MNENPAANNAISIYGQEGLDDFPVLKAFQQYIDAEQSKSRKRMIMLCIYGVAQSRTRLKRLSSSSRGWRRRRQWNPTPVLLPGKSHWPQPPSRAPRWTLSIGAQVARKGPERRSRLSCAAQTREAEGALPWDSVARVVQSKARREIHGLNSI